MVSYLNKMFNLLLSKIIRKPGLPKDLEHFYSNIIKEFVDAKGEAIENNLSHIVSIYNTYYAQIHTIPQQRLNIQSIFLSVNTVFASVIGYTLTYKHDLLETVPTISKLFLFGAPYIFIIFICIIWYRLLQEYDDLSYSFIMLIKSIEPYLPMQPLSMLFRATEQFRINHGLGRLTKSLPFLFGTLYFCMFIFVFTR